jgi:hypothetical protein
VNIFDSDIRGNDLSSRALHDCSIIANTHENIGIAVGVKD